MEFGRAQRQRVLSATLVSVAAIALFLTWYMVMGPGRTAAKEPSAMEALATQSSVIYTQPTAVVSVLTPTPTPGVPSAGPAIAATALDDNAATNKLISESAAARAKVAMNGQWAAQLASKYVGIVDPQQRTSSGSHTFTAADIFAEHLALHDHVQGASVYLLDSRSFGDRRSYNGFPYWVTVAVSDSFKSQDDVLTWCQAQFPTLSGRALNNRCLPTQLMG